MTTVYTEIRNINDPPHLLWSACLIEVVPGAEGAFTYQTLVAKSSEMSKRLKYSEPLDPKDARAMVERVWATAPKIDGVGFVLVVHWHVIVAKVQLGMAWVMGRPCPLVWEEPPWMYLATTTYDLLG